MTAALDDQREHYGECPVHGWVRMPHHYCHALDDQREPK